MDYKWLGKWIGAKMTTEDRFAPIFRKSFNVSESISEARIKICGLGLFELKINGSLPDDTVLNPAHTQYSQTVAYRDFDVTDLIRNGDNEITVELGNYFFNETTFVWDWHKASWRSAPKLIADLTIIYSDGRKETVSTDDSWLVTLDGPVIKNSIYYGETHDLRHTEYTWKKAVYADAPAGKLKLQKEPYIKRIAEFKPQEIRLMPNGSYVITAPEMLTGWAKLSLDIPEGTKITVTYSENLKNDGFVERIGIDEGRDANWWPDCYIQQDTFIAAKGTNIFEPKYSYKGFRYIQIDGCPCEIKDENITIYRVANNVETIGEFSCSDELINKLHALMKRTLLNNFQSKPTDTPVWEKNGWLGDANCALNVMMYNFDMSSYLQSFINIIDDCFREYGKVPVIVPTADWGVGNSPVWNTVFVFGVEALINFCGNTEYAEKLYPDLKQFALNDIEELESLGWVWGTRGLSDWLSPSGGENLPTKADPSEGAGICCTAFIYRMLESMIFIASKLGKGEDIITYKKARNQIYDKFNEAFFDAKKNIYQTDFWREKGIRTKYRQTSNLLPLAFGLVPEDKRKSVTDNLTKDIADKNYHLDTGCTGTRFVLPVLFDCGYPDIAYKILTQNTYPSWGFWIECGANSAWEAWEKTTRSQDHYFLATYDEALFSHIAGIKNIRDGYRSFTVKPEVFCGLEFAKASIKTPLGKVSVDWSKNADGGFDIAIEIPDGAKAEIILADKIRKTVDGGKYRYTV